MDENYIMLSTDNNKTLVVKSNSLMEAKFHFKLWEMRIFEKMISLIKKGDKEFRACKIYMKDLIEYFEGNSGNYYDLIKDAALSLGDKKLFIPYESSKGAKRWAKISIFPTVTIPDESSRDGENAYIELEFHNDLKPHLLDLKSRFKAYDIRNIQPLKSVYSIRIFILLKQFDVIGSRNIELEALKELLGIEKDQYPLYADFKKRVLLKPQQDLKDYCDICFDFVENKKGRKVHSIKFIIKRNEPLRTIPSDNRNEGEENIIVIEEANKSELYESQEALYSIVSEWGIGLDVFLQYLSARSENHIKECIEITEDSSANNKAAYFLTLVQKSEVKNGKKVTKKAKVEKKSIITKQENQQKQQEEALKKLKSEKYEKEQNIIKKLFQDKELLEAAQDITLKKRGNSFDMNLSIEENYAQKRVFKIFLDNAIMELKSALFEAVAVEFEAKEKELIEKYKK
jgi:plasmid replication initiation protein